MEMSVLGGAFQLFCDGLDAKLMGDGVSIGAYTYCTTMKICMLLDSFSKFVLIKLITDSAIND